MWEYLMAGRKLGEFVIERRCGAMRGFIEWDMNVRYRTCNFLSIDLIIEKPHYILHCETYSLRKRAKILRREF
jgi:hypothetical protein